MNGNIIVDKLHPNSELEILQQIKKLIDVSVGEDYFSIKKINQYINEHYVYSLSVYDKIVAVSLISHLNPTNLIYPYTTKLENTSYFVFDLLCVLPEYQKIGYGTQLFSHALKHLNENSIILAEAWENPDGSINASSLLTQFNFEYLWKIDNFWMESSLKEGYSCTKCGFPCTCHAHIFQLEI